MSAPQPVKTKECEKTQADVQPKSDLSEYQKNKSALDCSKHVSELQSKFSTLQEEKNGLLEELKKKPADSKPILDLDTEKPKLQNKLLECEGQRAELKTKLEEMKVKLEEANNKTNSKPTN